MTCRAQCLDLDVSPDPQPEVELSDCTDLVHVDTANTCPNCGFDLHTFGWVQPALFYFGGRGEATGRTFRRCASCRWTSRTDEAAVNPKAIGAHR